MEHYTALKITYCVQAKLWNGNHRPEHVKPDLVQTLTDLQLDYIDSFVIHWPQAVPSTGENKASCPCSNKTTPSLCFSR